MDCVGICVVWFGAAFEGAVFVVYALVPVLIPVWCMHWSCAGFRFG